jgi:hypothetical protein
VPVPLRLFILYGGKAALLMLSSFIVFAGIAMPVLIRGRHVVYLLSGSQLLAPNKRL